MWGRVWVLPLCTVIVVILSAPSASGAPCSCGGPTSDAPLDTAIDVLECGSDGDGPLQCDDGVVCVCNLSPEVAVTNLFEVINGAPAEIEWYCEHDGADGHCSLLRVYRRQ
ncbi:imm upregulated 9 [Ectocarpus siliculosus]|uniref:Imm upregulated 9 n=1 Tax=Ectocarpus siliculosus TaxID=2880 RepID=D7G5L1_ECTSI|nr:imm upregulated 9 [Ectocarpus siliculosus]|eukprot:CBJ33857.1 imm upregulated 9 [Ectocarpus siliculosus]